MINAVNTHFWAHRHPFVILRSQSLFILMQIWALLSQVKRNNRKLKTYTDQPQHLNHTTGGIHADVTIKHQPNPTKSLNNVQV